MVMRYLSLCSGIEAATVAWEPLGWIPAAFGEIEKFPSAVLAHHYPSVLNLGDITKINGKDFRGQIDLIVGGPPCQSYSVAGLRKGLDDPRGQLTFVFLKIVGEARPRWVVFENVPGLLSVDSGRVFGAILGEMAKFGYGFAYRILDAQFFGIPQRRRRIMLVGYLGDWRPAAAVLFERQSLSGDTPPSRGQRTKTARNAHAGPGTNRRPDDGQRIVGNSHPTYAIRTAQTSSNGWGITEDTAYTLDQAQGQCVVANSLPGQCFDLAPSMCAGAPFARTGNSRVECEALVTQALTGSLGGGGPDDNKAQGSFYVPSLQAFGGNNTSGPIEISPALNAHGGGSRRMDFESEAFVAQTLRGEGFDASEDGTGRANLIPINLQVATRLNVPGDKTMLGIGNDGDPAFTITKTHSHGVFIGAQSIALRGRDGGCAAELSGEVATALRAPQGGGDKAHVLQNLSVRRLTPVECERLQGFPDLYTQIPWRGKPASSCPDGPRYKALGNSMAVPVMRWIGERIDLVESLMAA